MARIKGERFAKLPIELLKHPTVTTLPTPRREWARHGTAVTLRVPGDDNSRRRKGADYSCGSRAIFARERTRTEYWQDA